MSSDDPTGRWPWRSWPGCRRSAHRGRPRRRGAGHDQLVHVDRRAGVEHGAPGRQPEHADRVRQALGGQRGAVHRVDRDVPLRAGAVADPLAVVEHRRLVLLALADHHHAVHPDGAEHRAHRVHRGRVDLVLVAEAEIAGAVDRRRLGGPDQLQGQVAVGVGRHPASLLRASTVRGHRRHHTSTQSSVRWTAFCQPAYPSARCSSWSAASSAGPRASCRAARPARLPEADGQPGRVRRAERGGLGDHRPADRRRRACRPGSACTARWR